MGKEGGVSENGNARNNSHSQDETDLAFGDAPWRLLPCFF